MEKWISDLAFCETTEVKTKLKVQFNFRIDSIKIEPF